VPPPGSDPPIEDSYRKRVTVTPDNVVLLDILDTAGQPEYSAMRDRYLCTGHGFLVVFSVIDRASFAEVDSFVQQILRVKDKHSVPMVLVGNKIDLAHERQVSNDEAVAYAEAHNMPYFEASARSGLNTHEIFVQAIREIERFGRHGYDFRHTRKSKRCAMS